MQFKWNLICKFKKCANFWTGRILDRFGEVKRDLGKVEVQFFSPESFFWGGGRKGKKVLFFFFLLQRFHLHHHPFYLFSGKQNLFLHGNEKKFYFIYICRERPFQILL